ncbi:mannose-1-phosphate guanylyltransferase/mannose-6-phosphate isomerase [Candidatus Deianiraea vastatrix]|uniref:mannose-1-phosphate guanylyltransferase n=1 Tax=Candidatus Deianiraea vastatrix TaxID=2163644 RepID=A0A5B8XJ74_9RICK|nr:mannose-1-phosphate guanylyltransferase/mannose-6-phosphate isomerase [Candidatus Deianiraea vastatrix]QED23894.1 Alginate biosynthesis protein AlgA [Candidatus Deianiraea vastatrix]
MIAKTLITIMVGGSGTRLWPLSRENMPKQFINLDKSGLTLFQQCVLRGKKLSSNILLIANFRHRFIIMEQLRKINLEEDKNIHVIYEPCAKNTLAVSIIASLFASKNGFEKVLLLPSDQKIINEDVFMASCKKVDEFYKNQGIVTFGIVPTFAHNGYGYIEKTSDSVGNGIFKVAKFTEKPDNQRAKQYLEGKKHLWNCGIFFFCPKFFLTQAEAFEKVSLEFAKQSFEHSKDHIDGILLNDEFFDKIRSDSIDFAIMQKVSEIFCIEIENLGWTDLGSFGQIYDIASKDEKGNLLDSDVYIDEVSNSHIINTSEKPLIAHGIEDLLIIAMKDAITITKKDSQGNKQMLEKLQNTQLPCLKNHCFDNRPWGGYENVMEKENFKIKIITVKPKNELSYQMHNKRSEHWICISGSGIVTLNDKEIPFCKDESIYIPVLAKHKIANHSKTQDLVFIEVQCGSYFGEDDIVRYEDKYGRV